MLYYRNAETEELMRQNRMTPRYAGLARKAFSYYLGDRYNPQEMDCELEYLLRQYIKGYVKLKVFDRIPYDWIYIDNFLRFALHSEGYKDLTYDEAIVHGGYHGIIRSELPEYTA